MREVIQKVIATEGEARRIVEAAKAEAARIVSDAQKQGEDLIARARQQGRREVEKIVAAAVQTAEAEKQEQLAGAAAELETQIRLDEATRQRAVAGALRCVCGER